MACVRLSPLAWTLTPIPMPPSLKAHESVGRFWLEGTGEGGHYRLAPVETLSQDEIVKITYAPPLPDGLSVEEGYARYSELLKTASQPPAPDLEPWRLALMVGPNELGYIATLPLAMGLIEAWRRAPQAPAEPIEAQLASAGLVFQYRLDRDEGGENGDLPTTPAVDPGKGHRIYRKEVHAQGSFSLALTDTYLHLTYEQDDQEGWHNLLRLSWGSEADERAPVWPTDRGHPRQLAITAALHVLKDWAPVRALSTGMPALTFPAS